MKDWLDRQRRMEFGQSLQLSWEFMASAPYLQPVLAQLAFDLAKTMARYGYKPEMETLKIIQREEAFNASHHIAARVWGEFQADPTAYIYELEQEVQKLRDLVATLIEVKEAQR